ncbi:hypothetical protein JYT44_03225, partial [Caldithrix abyssi]|nr:hypothetical protein [Caldithrix abyssi]
MAKRPASGLLMYNFLESFKDALLEKLNVDKTLVAKKRLKNLIIQTRDYINTNLIIDWGYKIDSTGIDFNNVKHRLLAITNTVEELDKDTLEYLFWPYFFVKISDEGIDKMATWFPDHGISETIPKTRLYPTHYLEKNFRYNPEQDNRKLWMALEGKEGTIQTIVRGEKADFSGIKSFQNKIFKNLFKRNAIDSFEIDLYTGNFSLLQLIVETNYTENGIEKKAQGLVSLCSPIIGFFNPIGKEKYDILIASDKKKKSRDRIYDSYNIGHLDMDKVNIYKEVYDAFHQVKGLDYLRSFHKELEQINSSIKERAEHDADKIFRANVLS